MRDPKRIYGQPDLPRALGYTGAQLDLLDTRTRLSLVLSGAVVGIGLTALGLGSAALMWVALGCASFLGLLSLLWWCDPIRPV